MCAPLVVQLNGQSQSFSGLVAPTPLSELIQALDLKADRIAVEHNGEIAPRSTWPAVPVHNGDHLEIVQFVGGGCSGQSRSVQPRSMQTG